MKTSLTFSRLITSARSGAVRFIHETPSKQDASVTTEATQEEKSFGQTLAHRFTVTFEVAVSKLFPAGMGWQAFSTFASDMGLQANEMGFFAMTGLGDAVGVGIGHTLYYGIKKQVYDPTILMKEQTQTALLLATATFFSGTAWQPAVNTFQSVDTSFVIAAVGTGVVTGGMFFTGLRVGRTVYGNMEYVEEGNSKNLRNDATLSAAIGCATATFVGTDVSYGDNNFLRTLFGVEGTMSNVEGVVRAGMSTSSGFTVGQTFQNLVTPKGKSWLD